ncbi:glycosyltransferase family 2 protein [Sinorhizobium meliloti]|nr:glycosyltransferase family 2 protein [Sinorhizobium meliloti]
MKDLHYPSRQAENERDRRGIFDRVLTRYETYKLTARVRKRRRPIEMSCLTEGGQRPLGKGDIPVVFNTHNDRKLMPSFLAHYRGLGVTRFICVDDVSSDGTRDYLACAGRCGPLEFAGAVSRCPQGGVNGARLSSSAMAGTGGISMSIPTSS